MLFNYDHFSIVEIFNNKQLKEPKLRIHDVDFKNSFDSTRLSAVYFIDPQYSTKRTERRSNLLLLVK